MGFLSKAFKKVKKQIQPGNMIARDMGPGNIPRRGGGFLSKIRNKAFDRIESGKIPARRGFLRGQYFGPRGNMGSDFRMPQKRGGFGFGLGEAIRRQRGGDMGMPRMEGSIPRMPGMIAGGTPGFYDRVFKTVNPRKPGMDDRLQMPQPIPERMPTDPSSYYNPTIFGQQMGDMDFSQMPKISPVDMSNLQMPTLPQEISQMDLPQMPEGLPSMQDVQGGRSLNFADYKPQKRQRMAEGDEVINRSPEQEIFSLQAQLENLEEQLRMDRSYNDDQAVIDTSAQMAAIQRRIQELLQESGQTISRKDSQMGFKAAGSIGSDDQGNPVFPEYAGGDEVSFPDLTGDGQVTQADILKGRGVYAEGGEIEAMLSGMDSGEEEAMGELEQMAPEMEMIDQLVNMVVQMIQQGASEEEVIMFLREQGLDDEDIGTVLQLVSEMAETEEAAAQNEIGADLEQLG